MLPAGIKTFFLRLLYSMKFVRVSFKRRLSPMKIYSARRLGPNRGFLGVNLVGYTRAEMGLGEAARGMAAALDAAQIPFTITNLGSGLHARQEDLSWAHRESAGSIYSITISCVNPDNRLNLRARVSTKILGARFVIGSWAWELPEFPEEWVSEFSFVDEVWTHSRFSQESISLKSPVPVVRMPVPVLVGPVGSHSRSYFNLPERSFLFLAMCDARSVLERKNPLGVLRAFKKAFRGDDRSVGLLLKISNPDYQPHRIKSLMEESLGYDNVFFIHRTMDRQELTSLITIADCFVSLHRAEGFGLGPAEAMALGKPVIVTNWSGNTDYITEGNAMTVHYRLVELESDYDHYKSGQWWAEPDIEHAAHWMRTVLRDPAAAASIGLRGRETITSEFSPERIGQRIRKRLEQITSCW
jgi:glycosyltransferase involved in cell wall biosynthesis